MILQFGIMTIPVMYIVWLSNIIAEYKLWGRSQCYDYEG